MRNIAIAAAVLMAVALNIGLGMGIQSDREQAAQQQAWEGMLVISKAGTLVANPAALTPKQLANYTIVDPMAHLEICTDQNGDTFVNPRANECQNFKAIHRY